MADNRTARHRDLRDLLRVVRRRKWIIIVTTGVVTVLALGLAELTAPEYEASARVLVRNDSTAELLDTTSGGARLSNDAATDLEVQLAQSQKVREQAEARLGFSAEASVAPEGEGVVIDISATSTDPAEAAAIANAYADAYVEVRQQGRVDDLVNTSGAIRTKIAEIDAGITQVNAQIDQIESDELAQAGGDPERVADANRTIETRTASLRTQQEALINQKATLQRTLDSIEVRSQVTGGSSPEVIAVAEVPTAPFKPRPARDGLVGLLAGLVLGFGLAFVVDILDDTVQGAADVESVTGAPVIALVPLIGSRRKPPPRLVSIAEPMSSGAEAFRSLRTSVQFASLERPITVVQVTSALPEEGKSTTAVNLAISFAQAGYNVLLVDADLRRPSLHDFFRVDPSVGLTSLLLGQADVAQASTAPLPDVPNLRLICSGPVPPDPSRLLVSKRAAQVMSHLREVADIVVVDTPPIVPVTDPLLLSDLVDAVVTVVRIGTTTRKQLNRTMELLEQVSAPVIGLVLNRLTSRGEEYSYATTYDYSRHVESSRRRRHDPGDEGGDRSAEPGAPGKGVTVHGGTT